MPLDRALYLERESYLWVTKELRITKKAIKNKLRGFSLRTKADLMSTGADTSKNTIATIWSSIKKINR